MTAFLSRRGLLGLALAAWLGLLDRREANQSPPTAGQPRRRSPCDPARSLAAGQGPRRRRRHHHLD